MVLKTVFAAVVCAAFLAAGSAMADGYKAGRISQPRPFKGRTVAETARAGCSIRAGARRGQDRTSKQSRACERGAKVAPKIRVAHVRTEKTHVAARTKLVQRHGNPLDAQAFDTRIQVWPCRSGGICNWQQ